MKNNFAEEYKAYLETMNDYGKAEKSGDKKGKVDARERYNRLMERIEEKGDAYARVYRLYSQAKKRENEYIDLNDVIWDREVKELISSFREYGIEKFTFSSAWSSAVVTAWLFIENGCSLEGMKEVNDCWNDFQDKYKKRPAYIFRVQ